GPYQAHAGHSTASSTNSQTLRAATSTSVTPTFSTPPTAGTNRCRTLSLGAASEYLPRGVTRGTCRLQTFVALGGAGRASRSLWTGLRPPDLIRAAKTSLPWLR